MRGDLPFNNPDTAQARSFIVRQPARSDTASPPRREPVLPPSYRQPQPESGATSSDLRCRTRRWRSPTVLVTIQIDAVVQRPVDRGHGIGFMDESATRVNCESECTLPTVTLCSAICHIAHSHILDRTARLIRARGPTLLSWVPCNRDSCDGCGLGTALSRPNICGFG